MQLLTPSLQNLQPQLCPAWQVNMDRSPHPCTKVGWARVDVSVLFREHKVFPRFGLHRVPNSLDATSKTIKDALHHGDNPELVLFIDPGEEGLLLIVEDAPSLGPVPLHASNLEVGVPGHKEEVVI